MPSGGLTGVSLIDVLTFSDLEGLCGLGERAMQGHEGREAFGKLLREIPTIEHHSLWRKIHGFAKDFMVRESLPVSSEDPIDIPTARTIRAVATIMSIYAEYCLDADVEPRLIPAFVEVAILAQDLFLALPDGHTQREIASALEKVANSKFEGREDFYGGVLMFLIGRCLEQKSTGADVARLHRVRHLIPELDWEHESIENLKLNLAKCTLSPMFMRSYHAPELLAIYLTVHPSFTGEIHEVMKNQVPTSRQSVLKGYANGLFKAWKSSEGGVRIQVEQCVQDWVQLAIFAVPANAAKARAVLEELHRHHHEAPVNDLLCRVYGPVLWRSLKVANWRVRLNATAILSFVFPLVPGDLGVADTEQELARQLKLLRETLTDPSEPNRRAGVACTCRILKTYWELLPASEMGELIGVLLDKCAMDKKAPAVRATVLEGLGMLLENALSHQLMNHVLPRLGGMLNDKSPVVRAAFVRLLGQISVCKSIALGDIVSNQALLLRLAAEHADGQADRLQEGVQVRGSKRSLGNRACPELVAQRLCELLAPSLFQQELPEQVQRSCLLMENWPLPFLALLAHAKGTAAPSDRVKLAAALFRMGLRDAVAQQKAAEQGALPGETAPRPKAVATMLRIVGILLEGSMATEKLPAPLEEFVYTHIREEDFAHLLDLPAVEAGTSAQHLREDLFFALSTLDVARLPRTAYLAGQELKVICSGTEAVPHQRLASVLRLGARWGIVASPMRATWEVLDDAAMWLGRRQGVAPYVRNALAVAEYALGDAAVRGAVLPTQGDSITKVVEALTSAFCGALNAGLREAAVHDAGAESVVVLGLETELWPRLLGSAMRFAVHVEYRQQPTKQAEAEAGSMAPTESKPGVATAALARLLRAAAGQPAEALLRDVEAAAEQVPPPQTPASRESAPGSPPAKRARVASAVDPELARALPADADQLLSVYGRLLECLSVARFLESGRRALKSTAPVDPAGEAAEAAMVQELESSFHRWARVSDLLRPRREAAPRLSEAFALSGRLLQQQWSAGAPTPEVMAAAGRLLERVTEETPEEEAELRSVLRPLFRRFEYAPELADLLAPLVGSRPPEAEEAAAAMTEGTPMKPRTSTMTAPEPIKAIAHARVVAAVNALLPQFRGLEAALHGQGGAKPVDKRRIFASPSPAKAHLRTSGGGAEAVDAEGGTPPPQGESADDDMEELIQSCFQDRSRRSGARRAEAGDLDSNDDGEAVAVDEEALD